MLLEAILTVVIVSVCLTLIAQSLLSNSRTGLRFQETVRALLVMENRLGLLFATKAAGDELDSNPLTLEKPYDKFTISARAGTINDHLKKVELMLNSPMGKTQGALDATTIIYNPDET